MSSLLHDEERAMFRLATLSRFEVVAGGNDGCCGRLLRTDYEISHCHQK